MAELPSGTVTFLFTDIEGSTQLLQQLGDQYGLLLDRHRTLLRAEFRSRGGQEVNVSGDSFFVVFPRAADAVAAAAEAQRALAVHPWPDSVAVRVRMGLHTGEPILSVGDYVGLDVHRAARLCAAGHGGQVLLSQTTRDLVDHELPPGVALRDLGEHRLKDLDHPERVFQLVPPDLPSEFPPLRSLDAHPHNLPIQVTSFIGREREIAEVRRLLKATRLLTLTGTGGSGKTRLAYEVAADVVGQYGDGAWAVELATVADPSLLPQTMAFALGIREEAGQPILSTLVSSLGSKELLLVLDNCEHLIGACARLADTLIRNCPCLQILATSREALAIAGEIRWRVPSLPAPQPECSARLEDVAGYEAVQLFVARAAAAEPGFALTHRNAPAVAQVCRRLDGIPLAIELAAARVKLLSVEQIAERLDDCFRLLSGGSRTALPRQQTLRAAIDWSYELLSDAERLLLRGLAVFAGGFDLDAAEAVCGFGAEDDGCGGLSHREDVIDLLAQLVDKSLVQVEKQAGEARYRLLETIRQYGREQLEQAGEARALRSRHRDWYLALAERAEPELWRGEDRLWVDRLELEHDNVRAALDWCLTTDPESGQRLAGSLWLFWERRGYLTEGRSWLEGMLARPRAPARADTTARAKALLGAGYLARDQGDITAARSRFEESLVNFRRVGDRWGIGSSLRGLGLLAQSEGDCGQARALFEQAVSLFREIAHTVGIGWTLRNLGILAQMEGDHARAKALFQESLPTLRQIGDKTGIGRVLGSLGILARVGGDYVRARALLEESRDLLVEAGDKRGVSMALGALGSLDRIQGDWMGARGLFEQSLALGREMGDRAGLARGLASLGVLAVQQGAHVHGVQLIGAATAIHKLVLTSAETDERADVEAAIAAAEAALGAQAFAAAWGRGQAMPVDAAIAQAMAAGEAMPGPSPLEGSDAGRRSAETTADPLTSPGPSGVRDAVRAAPTSPEGPAGGAATTAERPYRKRLPGGLTEREGEVLRLVARGMTNREIAAELVLSEYTVMRHLSNIRHKIGAPSRAAAASFAVREGIS